MGFFDIFKKSGNTGDNIVLWLNSVEAAYTKAFQVKNAVELGEYLTRACLVKQMERIRVGEKAYAGLERYKHLKWEKVSIKDSVAIYHKIVTYDQVKMSRGIVAAVGDDYREEWEIVIENGLRKVNSIRRL